MVRTVTCVSPEPGKDAFSIPLGISAPFLGLRLSAANARMSASCTGGSRFRQSHERYETGHLIVAKRLFS